MDKKFLAVPMQFKALSEEDGTFEAYLSVFNNVDRGGDKVAPGAFVESLKAHGDKPFPLLYQHETDDVIGGFTAVEDNIGLKMFGSFNLDVQCAREAYSNAKKGYLTGFSMGYVVKDYTIEDGVRILHKVDLWEGSIVTFPMNEAAQLTDIKKAPETERELEKALRDAGFSRSNAKAIVAVGFKGIKPQWDADAEPVSEPEAKADDSQFVSLLQSIEELKNVYSKS